MITLQGCGFGTKSTVAPLLFSDFNNGTMGQELVARDARWQSYSGDGRGLLFSNVAPHAGAFAVARTMTNGENFTTNFFTYTPASRELFVSYWWRVSVRTPGSTIIKMTRLSSSRAAGGGGVYNGAGATTLGGTYDLGDPSAGPYLAYTAQADGSDETPATGNWETNHFNPPPRETWIRVESFKRLSTAGAADGVIDYRLHSQQITNNTAMTRGAGATFLMDTVLLGAMDGSDAAHDYTISIDDVYIDKTRARVELCAQPRWVDRTHCEAQIPTTQWTNEAVQVRVNHGAFAAGSTAYFYVVDSAGVANPAGLPIVLP